MFKCDHKGNKKDCINAKYIKTHQQFIDELRYYRYRKLKRIANGIFPSEFTPKEYLEDLEKESNQCIACAKKARIK